jgi:hypothetical protein
LLVAHRHLLLQAGVGAVRQIDHLRRLHAKTPHLGLQGPAGHRHGIGVARQPPFLPIKEPLPQHRVRVHVVPAAGPLPIVGVEHQGISRKPPHIHPCQPTVAYGFKDVNHLRLKPGCAAGHAQRHDELMPGVVAPDGHVLQANAILFPGPARIGQVIVGGHQDGHPVAASHQSPGHKKGAGAHRALGLEGKGADHHNVHGRLIHEHDYTSEPTAQQFTMATPALEPDLVGWYNNQHHK